MILDLPVQLGSVGGLSQVGDPGGAQAMTLRFPQDCNQLSIVVHNHDSVLGENDDMPRGQDTLRMRTRTNLRKWS